MNQVIHSASPSMLRRIVAFPLSLLGLGSVWLVAIAAGVSALFNRIDFARNTPQRSLGAVLVAAALVAGYKAFKRWVERADDTELPLGCAASEIGLGLLAGTALFSLMTGIVALLGGFEVLGVRGWGAIWSMLGMAISTGVFEEILFRGIILRHLETLVGSWAALLVTSGLFGAAHLANPDSSAFAAVAIALEAGLLLGGAFLLTRRLWLPIGLHAAWNFAQGWIFSVPVSGGEAPLGLLITRRVGPDWLTGGAFGLEASVVAMVVATVAGIGLTLAAQRRGHMAAPAWRRGRVSG